MPPRRWHVLASAFGAASIVIAPLAARADPLASSASHLVQPGETLSQIALDAGVDAPSIASLNGLDDANVIVAGQTLKLPLGASSAAPVASAPAPPTPQTPRTYTVADGDTLWAIASQFGTSTDALAQLNSLDDADHLGVGNVLTLPVSAPIAPPTRTPVVSAVSASPTPGRKSLLVPYTVQPGETLTSIARQFDVRVDTIATASGLDDPNKLSVGTVLKVPLPGKEHVVTAGETLRDIAAAERVDLGSLIDFNELDDPALIRVGQVVLVPVAANPKPAGVATQASAPVPAAAPVPVVVAASVAAPSPSAAPLPAPPSPSPTPTPTQKPAPPKPVAPAVVVMPPKGAPTGGLAGAGLKLLGSPYVFGGSNPSGFDCSGFVWYVAHHAGKSISRGMRGEYNAGAHPAREELKPGDLVFFQNTYSAGLSHNGIYIGNGEFVHAADETDGVTISSLNTAYWSRHWFGATRLP